MIVKNQLLYAIVLAGLFTGCQFEEPDLDSIDDITNNPEGTNSSSCYHDVLDCNSPEVEETDYDLFRMHADGARVGDLMPIHYSGNFYLYHLKDVWNDVTHERHPWYAFTTNNLYSYAETGEILGSASSEQSQDFALGTGSVFENNGTFYAFYTGHNPHLCETKVEGVMLATSSSPNQQFSKQTSFTTLYAPSGQGFDEENNFRDPYVYYDHEISKYAMIVSARKDVSGTWKGVLAKFTSTNLLNWTYSNILYDGGSDNFFMMETAEIFEMGGTYYLLFSDIDTKHVYYRKSSSINGPWSIPTGASRFEGNANYAARTVSDGYDRYIFGWTHVNNKHSDYERQKWGGNLVTHKMYRTSNGDLAVTIPHTLEAYLETNTYNLILHSTAGNVSSVNSTYTITDTASSSLSNVIFDPINADHYQISMEVSYASSNHDFGFMIGPCDEQNDFFSLRFVPWQNKFRLDKDMRGDLDSLTLADNDVPFTMSSNTTYDIRIVVENSMVVVYLNNEVALSSRIYRIQDTHWGLFADDSEVTFANVTVTTP